MSDNEERDALRFFLGLVIALAFLIPCYIALFIILL